MKRFYLHLPLFASMLYLLGACGGMVANLRESDSQTSDATSSDWEKGSEPVAVTGASLTEYIDCKLTTQTVLVCDVPDVDDNRAKFDAAAVDYRKDTGELLSVEFTHGTGAYAAEIPVSDLQVDYHATVIAVPRETISVPTQGTPTKSPAPANSGKPTPTP